MRREGVSALHQLSEILTSEDRFLIDAFAYGPETNLVAENPYNSTSPPLLLQRDIVDAVLDNAIDFEANEYSSMASDGVDLGDDPDIELRERASIRGLRLKQYEIKDHLGNVRATISDARRLGSISTAGPYYLKDFSTDAKSVTDYYAFGAILPGRSYSSSEYRFGFNGMESDDEIKGTKNSLDFGARIYDPRAGVWLSRDPMEDQYPYASSYSFALNTPIQAVDPDGNLVLFINGLRMHQSNRDQRHKSNGTNLWSRFSWTWAWSKKGIYERQKAGALRRYWSKRGKNTLEERNVSMDQLFMNQIGDHNAYYTSGSSAWTSQATDRAAEGRMKAEMFHQDVVDGKIKLADGETIKIVTHSQGGAHAEGFARQLATYKDGQGNLLYHIEVIYSITPHQSGDMNMDIPGVDRTVQYSHNEDAVSGDGAPGYLPNGGSSTERIPGVDEAVIDHSWQGRDAKLEGTGLKMTWKGLRQRNRNQHNVWDNKYIFDNIKEGEPGYVAPRKDQPR